MNVLDIIFQIALIILPAGAVLMTTIYFLRREAGKDMRSIHGELKKQRQEFFIPQKAEAYQRAILFLERIHPNSLVMRLHNPGLPAKVFQANLLEAIREEYEHNIAQQLFIPTASWDMLVKSKDETMKIINIAGGQMDVTSMGTDLAAKIFEIVAEVGELPSTITVKQLKKEFQEVF